MGFDWNPLAPSQLWFTDNGRDLMGNNQPDDELNMLTWAGGFYGYPYCHTLGKGEPKRRSPGILATTPDPNVNKGNTVFNCSGMPGGRTGQVSGVMQHREADPLLHGQWAALTC